MRTAAGFSHRKMPWLAMKQAHPGESGLAGGILGKSPEVTQGINCAPVPYVLIGFVEEHGVW